MLSKPAATQLIVEAWNEATRRSGWRGARYQEFKRAYWNDPAGFVQDCIVWDEGKGPYPYQEEALTRLLIKGRESVRATHDAGKTALASWAILWFALTRDGDDWKVPTTASNWRQLSRYLWPEVHKWARRIRWDVIGRDPFDDSRELLDLSLKLSTGQAFALASNDAAAVEGAHADHLLFVYDEAKTIPDDIWDTTEGAFAGGNAMGLNISTPGPPAGRFYEIQTRRPGYENWDAFHIKVEDAIKAGAVSAEWVEERRRGWGEGSALFQTRVLAEFASEEDEGIIPLSWVEAANDRWREWAEQGFPGEPTGLGVDVGQGGTGDKTVIAKAFDRVKIRGLEKVARLNPKTATMEVAGKVKGLIDGARAAGFSVDAYADVIGIGAGVVHRLNEQDYESVIAFNAAERTEYRDSSKEYGFADKRSAGWWIVREMLDPNSGDNVALPLDDELTGDLTAPHYETRSNAKIKVEQKSEIRKRIGRSTDAGDSVMMVLSGPTLCALPKAKVVTLG